MAVKPTTTCNCCGSSNVNILHEPRYGQWRGQCQDCWSLGAWSGSEEGAVECWDCKPLKCDVAEIKRKARLRRRGGEGA